MRRDGHALVLSSTSLFPLHFPQPLLMGSKFPLLALHRTWRGGTCAAIDSRLVGKIAGDKRRTRPHVWQPLSPVATSAYHPATSPTPCSSSTTDVGASAESAAA